MIRERSMSNEELRETWVALIGLAKGSAENLEGLAHKAGIISSRFNNLSRRGGGSRYWPRLAECEQLAMALGTSLDDVLSTHTGTRSYLQHSGHVLISFGDIGGSRELLRVQPMLEANLDDEAVAAGLHDVQQEFDVSGLGEIVAARATPSEMRIWTQYAWQMHEIPDFVPSLPSIGVLIWDNHQRSFDARDLEQRISRIETERAT